MATLSIYVQGASPTEVEATDKIQFAEAAFDSAIAVGQYNGATHVETSVGGNKSSGNTPNNNKFISQTGGGGGDSQADWGDGTEDLDQITDAEATLHINFAHGVAVSCSNIKMYEYDGTTPATPTTDLDTRLAEVGDTNFTEAEGSGSPLNLSDSGSATSHDFYVVPSVSPESVTEKIGAFAFELQYQ
jgi:hypothetical protein